MLESLIMLIGTALGYFLLKTSSNTKKIITALNNKMQIICVAVIIFIMGINLGSIDKFAQKMISLGTESIVFAVVPTVFSVAVVYLFTKTLIKTR